MNRSRTLLAVAAKLLYEVSRVVVDSRRHPHVCLFTDASRPPSCVVTGYSNCTGKAAVKRDKAKTWVAPRIGGYQAKDNGAPKPASVPPGRGSASPSRG